MFSARLNDGVATLGDAPGLGVEPDLRALARYASNLPEGDRTTCF
jgi:L-alanine-DL-glutamate epimerase-like enolase superfamily enzyme